MIYVCLVILGLFCLLQIRNNLVFKRELRLVENLWSRHATKLEDLQLDIARSMVAVRQLEERDRAVRDYLRELHAWIKARWTDCSIAGIPPEATVAKTFSPPETVQPIPEEHHV